MPHSDVIAWLREIGLEQLTGLFAEPQIELEDLPDLTEQDLEKLGTPLGPRKRLMKAIAALNRSHFFTVLRHNPVRRAISDRDSPSR